MKNDYSAVFLLSYFWKRLCWGGNEWEIMEEGRNRLEEGKREVIRREELSLHTSLFILSFANSFLILSPESVNKWWSTGTSSSF